MEHRDPETGEIIGAAMDVHSVLGCGFLESVYHEALRMEMKDRGIPFSSEVELPIYFKGTRMETYFRADLICFNAVVVELKALNDITGKEEAQLLNYLKVTGHKRGLILNFGSERLQVKRMVLDY